jgi:hypothetical protein
VAATANEMGPSKGIGSTCQRSNGSIQSYRQLPLQMQWAHPRASTTAAGEIAGPAQSHWQLPLQIQWAHPRASGAPAKEVMGPSKIISSCHCKCNGCYTSYPILSSCTSPTLLTYHICTTGPFLPSTGLTLDFAAI